MNSANVTPGNPEEKVEQPRQQIDLKAKLKEFIGQRAYEERKLFEEAVWEDPEHDWRATDKKWETGFLEYVAKKVAKDGEFRTSIFEDYLKKLQRRYENTSSSQEPELKKFCKAQLEVSKKILGLYSVEGSESQKKKNEAERMKSIYSWENIKFTVRNIRRQVFELFLGKGGDPFFDYSQLQKGEAQLAKQATGGAAETPVPGPQKPAAQPVPAAQPAPSTKPSREPTLFEEFLQKRSGGGKNGSHGAEPPQKEAA